MNAPLMQNPSKKRSVFWLIVLLGVVLAVIVYMQFFVTPTQPATTETKNSFEPVVYQTQTWMLSSERSADIEKLKAELGAAASSEDSLDFYGKPAQLYRFSAKHEPPLSLMASDASLELVWYAPQASDDMRTKQIGIEYAKRSYRMMSMLGGQTGADIVRDVLTKDHSDVRQVGGFRVLRAQCKAYRCQIVLGRR